MTPSTVAHEAPLSMGFSRQGYWSELPCPPPGDIPNPGIKTTSLKSPALAGGFFTASTTREAHFTHSGTPLRHSCLENPMDGGALWAAVHGVTKSRTRLSDFTCTFLHWRRKWQPTPVILPGESQGWRSLVGLGGGAVYGVAQSRTRLKLLSSSSSGIYVSTTRSSLLEVKSLIMTKRGIPCPGKQT